MIRTVIPIDWRWFSDTFGCIGVVFAFDAPTNMYHGYIGLGAGNNEERDCYRIISNGCRLTQEETRAMIGEGRSRELIDSIPDEQWKK